MFFPKLRPVVAGFGLSLSLLWAATPPALAESRVFKDWRADCSTEVCKAATMARGGKAALRFWRLEKADAPGHISFGGLGKAVAKDSALSFRVDKGKSASLASGSGYVGRTPSRHDIVDQAALVALFPQLQKGTKAYLRSKSAEGKKQTLEFSLSGIAAALLWIDDRQGRVGTVRTVGAPKPNTAKAAKASRTAPKSVDDDIPPPPQVILKRHRADDSCGGPGEPAHLKNFHLGGVLDKNRVLYILPCHSGAYNFLSRIYVFDKRYPEEAGAQYFADYSDSYGWLGTNTLTNTDYDAKTKTLTAFHKGRGIGDCGSAAKYRWLDYAFRLLEFAYWGKCDGTKGPEEWPVIYRHKGK